MEYVALRQWVLPPECFDIIEGFIIDTIKGYIIEALFW